MRARATKPTPSLFYKIYSKEEIALANPNTANAESKLKVRKHLPTWFHYTLMCIPGYVWLFMFSIVPMVGIVMAFQNFNPSKGWFGSPWVGLDNFEFLWVIPDAKRALGMKFKKGVQTIVYLPHFISWVLLANIITNMLGANGILNTILNAFGQPDVLLMTEPKYFKALLIGTEVWKEFGYNAVIYLAALTGIDPSLYEAAAIDGASRWQSTRHITLPSLISTVVLLTTLAMGNVLNAGFDQVFNMYNPVVMEVADILDTYVYRLGIVKLQFSLSTAAGLFKSVVSFVLVVTSYALAYKFADYTIF